jgi:hypothetical protein
VALNTAEKTVGFLATEVMKGALGMLSPEASMGSSGVIDCGADDDDDDDKSDRAKLWAKPLSDLNIVDNTVLDCTDELQDFHFKMTIVHTDAIEDEKGFVIAGDAGEAKAMVSAETKEAEAAAKGGSGDGGTIDDDDLVLVETVEDGALEGGGGSGGEAGSGAQNGPPRTEPTQGTSKRGRDDDDDDGIVETEAPVGVGAAAKRSKPNAQ